MTNAQKQELVNLFRRHGDDKPAEWYSQEVGIRLFRTRDLLSLLRNGKSIMPKGHYRRKSRVEPFQRLIARCLEKNPTVSIGGLRECLKKLVDECCAITPEDDQAMDPERLDKYIADGDQHATQPSDTTAEETGTAAETDMSSVVEDRGSQMETDMDDVDGPVDEPQTSDVSLNAEVIQIPSKSAILSYVKGESGDSLRRDIPVFSFKRETVRGTNSNTDQNKQARVDAINRLNDIIRAGHRWVCLDESSWRVACTSVYGWSPRGSRCFITKSKMG